MNQFRSYELAVEFYKMVTLIKVPFHLKGQLQRASSSVALNLAEGSAKTSSKERAKFYRISLGSFRECAAILQLISFNDPNVLELVDKLARHLYKLCKALE